MYEVDEFRGLSAHAALSRIKERTDATADRSAGLQVLVAHLEGIWDAFALLAERVDALDVSSAAERGVHRPKSRP